LPKGSITVVLDDDIEKLQEVGKYGLSVMMRNVERQPSLVAVECVPGQAALQTWNVVDEWSDPATWRTTGGFQRYHVSAEVPQDLARQHGVWRRNFEDPHIFEHS
jgi:hypothetical protein